MPLRGRGRLGLGPQNTGSRQNSSTNGTDSAVTNDTTNATSSSGLISVNNPTSLTGSSLVSRGGSSISSRGRGRGRGGLRALSSSTSSGPPPSPKQETPIESPVSTGSTGSSPPPPEPITPAESTSSAKSSGPPGSPIIKSSEPTTSGSYPDPPTDPSTSKSPQVVPLTLQQKPTEQQNVAPKESAAKKESPPETTNSLMNFGLGRGRGRGHATSEASRIERAAAIPPAEIEATINQFREGAQISSSEPKINEDETGDSQKKTSGQQKDSVVKSGEDTAQKQTPATSIRDPGREKVHAAGTFGKKVTVCSNYVQLSCKQQEVYQYHVEFKPKIENKKLCSALIHQAAEAEFVDSHTGRAYDGQATLYLAKQISSGPEVHVTKVKDKEGKVYELRLKLAKIIPIDSPLLIPLYNTIVHKIQKEMHLIPIRDAYYNMAREKKIAMHGISVWPGYVATVQQRLGGLMLMVDLSFKVLRNQNVLSIFGDCKKKGGDFKATCYKALIGQTILTRYNNKNYRIDDIDFNVSPMSTFTRGFGDKAQEITYAQYYKEQYDVDIKDKKQPLLVNRPKKKMQRKARADAGQTEVIYLIPELCNATGLTDAMRTDFKVMQELAKTTRVTPEKRNSELQAFIDQIKKMPFAQEQFNKWGINIEPKPVEVIARNIRDKDEILLGKNVKKPINPSADFGRDVVQCPMIEPIDLKQWSLIYTAKDEKKVKNFVDCYKQCARALAQNVATPKLAKLSADKTDVLARQIADIMTSCPETQLIVNFMASKREDKYNATKDMCCVRHPVPSQCIVSRTLPDDPKQGKFRSVTQKIALQINAKLGGSLWAVKIPIKNMMLVGIDTWHGSTKTSKRAAVTGLVASYSKDYTKWYSRAIFQDSADHDLCNKLGLAFGKALQYYQSCNGTRPELIVLFRDGVSDGGLEAFKDTEMESIKSMFSTFPGDYNPKFACMIVSKRINTRMYEKKGKTLDNPMPGTILDVHVNKPYYQDFYLVSQHVRQGTVTPTHFIVLEDGGQKPDNLQKLSYKMTHMYYNWPGTVRVPAPCQYAHKLASLIGENVQKDPASSLADKLYYL